MARYLAATWRPLPESTSEPLITATQVILHTAVSDSASLFGFFASDETDLESHFYVNESGHVEQYIDTARQADANRTANVRAISIETWDGRDPEHTPWNPAQLAALEKLIAWICRTHNIPAVKCPAHDRPGIGWHTMWGAPSPWTPVSKSCPGAPRKLQSPPLIARVRAALNPQEDDVALTDAQAKALDRIDEIDTRTAAIFKLLTDEGDVGRRSKEITIGMRALLGRDGDMDEAEVARKLAPLVLAGMPVDEIANAVVEALPDEQAKAFLDALAVRIAG